jgi:nitrogenase molybdenum-iron protein alpha/beta subunit
VARRTGAEILELPLPFGPKACEHWLRTLGEKFGRAEAAQAYLDERLSRFIPRIEWLVPFVFQNLEVGYVGDPHLLPGFADIVELLGGQLRFAIVTNRATHLRISAPALDESRLLVWPKLKAFIRFLIEQVLEHDVRLLVANNYGVTFPLPDTAVVEFGFPSLFQHALFERPFLGLDGFMAFVDSLANALRQTELARSRADRMRSP